MKKVIILLAVVVVLLGAGQFYSASKFEQALALSHQAMQQQGFEVAKNEVDKGLFSSSIDTTYRIGDENMSVELSQHSDVTHLPWGANYSGNFDLIIGEDTQKQRLFTGLMDTDPVLMNGSYNAFSGGSGTMTFAKFKVDTDDMHIAMPKAVVVNYTHSSDFKIIDNDFVIDSFSIKGKDDFTIEAQKIGAQIHQDHVWPEDEFMHSNGVISLAKLQISEAPKQLSIALNNSQFTFNADVDKNGNASYGNQMVVRDFKIHNPQQPNFNADAKLDFAFSGINIASLRNFVQKMQKADLSDEKLLASFIDEHTAELETAAKKILQQSKPVIELRELSFNSDNDDMKNLKAKGLMHIFSDKIDIAELLQSHAQMPMGFGAGAYLIDKLSLEFDASGHLKGMLPGPYGDKIQLRIKDGAITINDQVVPF